MSTSEWQWNWSGKANSSVCVACLLVRQQVTECRGVVGVLLIGRGTQIKGVNRRAAQWWFANDIELKNAGECIALCGGYMPKSSKE